ncbi:MAG: DUF4388 domain-containing protein [Acidobacteriota bacterium]|nr:DUF4388 domain-containing protein [Acidobacteriota bacterium]
MSTSGPGEGGSPAISGRLSETPLFVVMRQLQREQLSGTLSVLRGDQVRQLVFEKGELYAARSSREDHRIGATLVRWGYISEEDLAGALEAQKENHERIDRILVEKGLVTRAVIDSEARRQMEQVVFSTLSWPDGSYHFERNTGPVELDVATSLSQEMIIEGIRRIPESEQFMDLLGDLSDVPMLTRDPMSSGSLRLLKDAVGLISQIDGTTSLRDLLQGGSTPGTASAKILYSLLFAGVIEMHSSQPVAAESSEGQKPLETREERRAADRRSEDRRTEDRRAADRRAAERKPAGYLYDIRGDGAFQKAADTGVLTRPAEPPVADAPKAAPRAPFRTPREVVLETHRRLDWLSHYDLLGVSRRATAAEIEEAYRTRARLFDPSLKAHPELVDCWRQLTVLAKWLRVAYGVLSNADSRAAYDQKISDATPAPPPEGAR